MSDLSTYLVFDIGCLECGEPSSIVGFADDMGEAKTMADEARVKQEACWEGQHSFQIFDTRNHQRIKHE